LAEAVRLEGSADAVAALYEVPKTDVLAAVEFEQRLGKMGSESNSEFRGGLAGEPALLAGSGPNRRIAA